MAYPPLAPLIAPFALTLFGPSLTGLRYFSTSVYAISMVLTGPMARALAASAVFRMTFVKISPALLSSQNICTIIPVMTQVHSI